MRKLAVGLLIIGVVAGVTYVHSGVRNRLFFPLLFTTCLILSVIEFSIKGKFRSRTQAVMVFIVAVVIGSIYIVAAMYGLA